MKSVFTAQELADMRLAFLKGAHDRYRQCNREVEILANALAEMRVRFMSETRAEANTAVLELLK